MTNNHKLPIEELEFEKERLWQQHLHSDFSSDQTIHEFYDLVDSALKTIAAQEQEIARLREATDESEIVDEGENRHPRGRNPDDFAATERGQD